MQHWEPDSLKPCVSHHDGCAAMPQKHISKMFASPLGVVWRLSVAVGKHHNGIEPHLLPKYLQ